MPGPNTVSQQSSFPLYAPPLLPKMAPWMERFTRDYATPKALIDKFGSPVHVVVESEFRRNVKDLLSPFAARNLQGGLFFARKANKLPWFVSAAADAGIGVDTASLSELTETISLGVDPQKVTVTAIGKSSELISTAIQFGAMIVVDNSDELNLVDVIASGLGVKARVGLRFSGFTCNGRKVFSRFGFPVEEGNRLIERACRSSSLNIELLHAHLDRYDTSERAAACRHLLGLVDRAGELGVQIKAIDLGGGILMRYLQEKKQFDAFVSSLIEAVRGTGPKFTYQNDGLGYYNVGNEVQGKADLYPAWNDISKERFIAAVLDNTDNGIPLHEEIRARNVEVYFEPGRALLDNVGMTISSVTFRKRDSEGNLLIGVAMNRTNLRPFRAEFCSDPLIMPSAKRDNLNEGAYLVGNLCSESDLIYRRKLRLPVLPQPGDIVCFFNTAGYLAHHMEIGTHGDPLPINVLLNGDSLQLRDFHC